MTAPETKVVEGVTLTLETRRERRGEAWSGVIDGVARLSAYTYETRRRGGGPAWQAVVERLGVAGETFGAQGPTLAFVVRSARRSVRRRRWWTPDTVALLPEQVADALLTCDLLVEAHGEAGALRALKGQALMAASRSIGKAAAEQLDARFERVLQDLERAIGGDMEAA